MDLGARLRKVAGQLPRSGQSVLVCNEAVGIFQRVTVTWFDAPFRPASRLHDNCVDLSVVKRGQSNPVLAALDFVKQGDYANFWALESKRSYNVKHDF